MRQTMASSTSKERPSQAQSERLAPLSYVAFVLVALLSLAPLAQAQTNRPSGTVVSWGTQFVP